MPDFLANGNFESFQNHVIENRLRLRSRKAAGSQSAKRDETVLVSIDTKLGSCSFKMYSAVWIA